MLKKSTCQHWPVLSTLYHSLKPLLTLLCFLFIIFRGSEVFLSLLYETAFYYTFNGSCYDIDSKTFNVNLYFILIVTICDVEKIIISHYRSWIYFFSPNKNDGLRLCCVLFRFYYYFNNVDFRSQLWISLAENKTYNLCFF